MVHGSQDLVNVSDVEAAVAAELVTIGGGTVQALDELVIYNRALSAAEVAELALVPADG